MSSARLPSALIIELLRRGVEAAGGFCTILQRGESDAGGILLILAEKGAPHSVLEKTTDFDGVMTWRSVTPPAGVANAALAKWLADYGTRRIEKDRDCWLLELDIADAARFAAQIAAFD